MHVQASSSSSTNNNRRTFPFHGGNVIHQLTFGDSNQRDELVDLSDDNGRNGGTNSGGTQEVWAFGRGSSPNLSHRKQQASGTVSIVSPHGYAEAPLENLNKL